MSEWRVKAQSLIHSLVCGVLERPYGQRLDQKNVKGGGYILLYFFLTQPSRVAELGCCNNRNKANKRLGG